MGTSKKQKKVNKFDYGMNSDVLLSQQDTGMDWRFALNAVKKTDSENDFGLGFEGSNSLHTKLPDGYDVRGLCYVEESNKYVVFLFNPNGSISQIGIIDENNRTYTEIVNDVNSKGQLNFSMDEWIDCTVKYITFGQCQHLFVYWSNGDTYKFADLDDECCDYSDMILFDCVCPTTVEATVHDFGGRLYNASYMFAIQLEDDDGNTTNFGKLSNAVIVSGNDNTPGENSDKSISIRVTSLTNRYSKINIAVVKTVLGITTTKIIKDVHYGGGQFSYMYMGDNGREVDSSLTEILGRQNRFIKGKNLTQYKSRLILYKTKPVANLDYQALASKIKVGFNTYVVPSSMAKNYKCLRPNENYMMFIRWNYCDSTSSAAFPLINRDPLPSDLDMIPPLDESNGNCKECEIPRWMAQDTSIINQIHIGGVLGKSEKAESSSNASNVFSDIKLDAPTLEFEALVPDINPNEPDHKYADSDIPNYSNVISNALSVTSDQFEAQLDCTCGELEQLLVDINALPFNEKVAALADADLQLLICYCNSRDTQI